MFKSFTTLAARRFYSSNTRACVGPQLSHITRIWLTALPKDSQWIAPCQMHFIENGIEKTRDMFRLYDSVMVILYNISKKRLIYVRQFRPAVYQGIISGNSLEIPKDDINLVLFPPELGITLEPVGGIVDKDKSLADIAREEVLEECGYDVPVDKLEHVLTFRSGVGASSAAISIFYCEVCNKEKIKEGGGVGDEVIQTVELPIAEARSLVRTGTDINSGPGTVICTLWFLANKV